MELDIQAPTFDNLQWTQWQLVDSVLPTGGFAHSYGLEAAIQAHIAVGPEGLKTHLLHVLDNTGSLLLPFVYTMNRSPDLETWLKLDKLLEATLTNEVSRKASASQGSALLRVAASVFSELSILRQIREEFSSSGTAYFHHAAVFGLISALVGFDSQTAQRAYLFMTMRDTISAATRLNLIGPLGASVLQHQVGQIAEELLRKWMNRPVEEACQTAPLLDAVQGCHSYLFSRLFCSWWLHVWARTGLVQNHGKGGVSFMASFVYLESAELSRGPYSLSTERVLTILRKNVYIHRLFDFYSRNKYYDCPNVRSWQNMWMKLSCSTYLYCYLLSYLYGEWWSSSRGMVKVRFSGEHVAIFA